MSDKIADRIAALDALAEKATDSEWHPTFQAKTEFQNALVNAWRTWLRDAAIKGLESGDAARSQS